MMRPEYSEKDKSGTAPERTFRGEFIAKSGHKLPYMRLEPNLTPGKKYPLIVHFHGAGSWASDYPDPPGQCLAFVRNDFPAVVLAPKTDHPMKWADMDWTQTEHQQTILPQPSTEAAYELILHLLKTDSGIDPSRVYITGQSMGGFGTWDFITRYREIVAAAVPVCGGGDVASMERIKDLPVWIFHGDSDPVVPVENSRKLYAALKQINASVHYTEYPGVEHAAWEPAFRDDALFRWLFEQKSNEKFL